MIEFSFDTAGWQNSNNGAWLMFQVPSASDATRIFQSLEDGKKYDVVIKEHRNKRSLDANAYCWVLIDRLAATLNISKEEIYRSTIKNIGGNNTTICVQDKAVDKLIEGWSKNGIGWVTDTMPSKIDGCTNVTLYYGSSTYDTKQMSRLIDLIVQECKEQGIETMTPAELERLKGEWR